MSTCKANKPLNWKTFISQWGLQFNDAKHILSYINSYPKSLVPAGIKSINTANNIVTTQKEWLRLLPLFYHPQEINFFKPWWVLMDINDYDYYMDLSDSKYPIFEVKYYGFKSEGWNKLVLFPDVSELLLMIENKRKISSHLKKIRSKEDENIYNTLKFP
jgi:hypothetical protein